MHAHDHLGGLAGADLVEEADGGLVEHPRDGGALVRARRERRGQAGQRQALALGGVVAQDDRVEAAVVLGEQPRAAVGVLPHPLAEALLQRLGLLDRRRRSRRR